MTDRCRLWVPQEEPPAPSGITETFDGLTMTGPWFGVVLPSGMVIQNPTTRATIYGDSLNLQNSAGTTQLYMDSVSRSYGVVDITVKGASGGTIMQLAINGTQLGTLIDTPGVQTFPAPFFTPGIPVMTLVAGGLIGVIEIDEITWRDFG